MDSTINISTATIGWAVTAFIGFFGREIMKFIFERLVLRSANGKTSARAPGMDQQAMLAMREVIRETVEQSVATELEKTVLPFQKTTADAVDKLASVSEQIKDALVKLTTIAEERRFDYSAPPRRRRRK